MAKAKAGAKKKKTKTTTTKTKKALDLPEFLFLGEGSAGYYEWLTMYVWFQDPVPKAKRTQVLAGIPEPLSHSIHWDGNVLSCGCGDQFIHMHIAGAYDDEDADFDPDGSATESQLDQFEADIRTWLVAAHAKAPILFAVRGEDGEGGGTELGAWHERSMTEVATKLLPVFATRRDQIDSATGWAMGIALELYQDHGKPALDAASAKWLATWAKQVRRNG